MAKDITSWKELEKALMADIADGLSKADELKNTDNDSPVAVLIHSLDTEFYQRYKPKWYENSWGLRDSIKGSDAFVSGGVATMQVYHDTKLLSKLHSEGREYLRYGWRNDFSEQLPDVIEGTLEWGITRMFPADGAWRGRGGYTANAIKELENGKLKSYMMRRLKEKGWNVVL